MPKAPLYDLAGKTLGDIDLPEGVFDQPIVRPLLKQAVDAYLANQRQGTSATKTRGMVRGGGRKPWRQKHTGRARQGSIRAPHWRHGGITFGPMPRDHRVRLPKAMRRKALKSALSVRAGEGGVLVVKDLAFEKPRTREFTNLLGKLPRQGRRALVVTAGHDANVYLSGRNVTGVTIMASQDLNVYQVLRATDLIIADAALDRIKEALLR